MAHATLGYPGGPFIAFRVDPESMAWNWQVVTNVVETIGGRVIQILGAYLTDFTITGSLGQDHNDAAHGESWQQANEFLYAITRIMEQQSADATNQSKMNRGAIFTYAPLNWRFQVYVKSLTDPDGQSSVILRPGKFNQRYVLTLFIIPKEDSSLVKAGSVGGVFNQKAYDAIAAFMARISDGIGWHFTQYNGPVPSTGPGSTTPSPTPAGSG